MKKQELTARDGEKEFADRTFPGLDLTGASLVGARNYAINVRKNKGKDAEFSLPEAMALLCRPDIKLI